jgi:hypothetical protein
MPESQFSEDGFTTRTHLQFELPGWMRRDYGRFFVDLGHIASAYKVDPIEGKIRSHRCFRALTRNGLRS